MGAADQEVLSAASNGGHIANTADKTQASLNLPDLASLREGDLPAYALPRASIADGQLSFFDSDGFDRALDAGFFLLQIPPELDLAASDRLGQEYFKARTGGAGDEYRGFKDVGIADGFHGYFDRPYDQMENLFFGEANWDAYLPRAVCDVGVALGKIATDILDNVLRKVGIAESQWPLLTGGLSSGRGYRMLGFNHYRAEMPVRGSKFHRDGSWITVLRLTQPGLVAMIDGRAFAIAPEEGYFVVNFGNPLEILTQALPRPTHSIIHGVMRCHNALNEVGRTSYTMCIYSDMDAAVYSYENGAPVFKMTMPEFVAEQNARGYNEIGHQL